LREMPRLEPGAVCGRLDKWLWHARVTKSRTGAQSLIVAGQVRVNRQRVVRASHEVVVGDVLTSPIPHAESNPRKWSCVHKTA
jgi:ribosomal 50S subunit-recycling heat shock protein